MKMETMVLLLLHKRTTLMKNEEFKSTANAEQELLIESKDWKVSEHQDTHWLNPSSKDTHTLTLLCLPMLSI